MIYTIETLPIVTFVKIAETNEIQRLLKHYPSNKHLVKFVVWIFKLENKWKLLSEEYTKHDDNKKSKKVDELKRKVSKEQGKYYAIIAALEVLKYGSDTDMLKIINSYGYTIKGEYWSGLEQVYKQVANLKNKIDALEDEIKAYSNVGEEKDINIYDVLTNLFTGLDMPFKANELTTIEYIFYRKQLIKKIKANNKK
jgi:hypothetical protein